MLISLCVLHSLGCSQEGEPSSVQGVYEKNAGWDTSYFKTCFASGEVAEGVKKEKFKAYRDLDPKGFTTEEQKAISNIVKFNTMFRTPYLFTHWGSCPKNPYEKGYKLVFLKGGKEHEWTRSTQIGQTKKREVNHRNKWYFHYSKVKSGAIVISSEKTCGLFSISPLQCLKGLALHEVGHFMGLRHTHVHPEAKNDPLCYLQGKTGEESEFFQYPEHKAKTTGFSKYDKKSVMNYCHLFSYFRGESFSGIKNLHFTQQDYVDIWTPFLKKEKDEFVEED